MSFNILYLRLAVLQLNRTHIQLLQQAIEHSIKAERSLVVLLDPSSTTPRSIETTHQWEQWQSLLGTLYLTQVRLAYAHDQPLFDMTVYPFLDDTVVLSGHPSLFATTHDLQLLQEWNDKRQHMGRPKFEEIHTMEGHEDAGNIDDDKEPSQCFERVVVGGTFDHLHAGHKILLTMTALLSTRDIVVGVTDDAMLQSKKHKEWLEPIEERLDHVRDFCQRIRPNATVSAVPIADPYGPTITDPTLEALVCSQETLKGGHMVNDERRLRNYPPLVLRVIDVISPDDDQTSMADKISSTWIRHYLATRAAHLD